MPAVMQMPTELLLDLRDTFNIYFDEEGLKDFALALGVDYESLPGNGKSARARELALHLWRHSKLGKLAEVGPKRRSDVNWEMVAPYKPASTQPTTPTPLIPPVTKPKASHGDIQQLIDILAGRPEWLTPDSRRGLLYAAGVWDFVTIDLAGGARTVASNALGQLNEKGRTDEGDTALGRLLNYVAKDKALPGDERETIQGIVNKHQL
jgi:hypothetical protein